APAASTLGWRATGQREQMSLSSPIQAALVHAFGQLALQGSIQPFLNCTLTHACNGRQAHIQCRTDHRVGPGWSVWTCISFEQDPSMDMRMSCGTALCHKRLQPSAFGER